MKKHCITAGALVLFTALGVSAKGNITGKVVNNETGEPMDFVNIQLQDAKTGKNLTIGTSTGADGTFTLTDVGDGDYNVLITSMGSVSQERPAKVAGGDVSIGVVNLADDSKLLKEVVVEGIKSQMRFELDKKVFQVDANVMAAGQSASELLESIPSVEVDQDGEVSLRGNSSVTVWINGKESGLTADNRAQILEQIPAETIDRIEVITNPSAKYSPEGTAGIINIVLKKERKAGYFGSAEIGANSRGGGNASVNFNYNSSKWEAFASVGFRMRHNKGGSLSRRSYENGDFLNSDGVSKNHGNNLFVRAGVTYNITDKDALGLNGFGMFGHRWGHSSTDYFSNLPGQWIYDGQLSRNRSDMRGAHGELTYTHKWNDNHTLDFTAGYNHWGGPQWSSYHEQQIWDDTANLGEPTEQYRTQNTDIGTDNWEVKLDYTNRFTEWLKLEAGFNGNYSVEDTPVTGEYFDMEMDRMRPFRELYNQFKYRNNISALYFTLGGKVKNFSFSAGLRGEAWQIRTRSKGYLEMTQNAPWSQIPLYKSNKFSLFPSLFLSYSLPMDNEIQVNYTRRIRRPWGGQLNSFMDISDPVNISFGNPELEPQYSNAFELNYIKNWTMHILSFSAYLRTSDNIMNRISFIQDGVMYTTWANVSNEINSGAEIVSKNSLFRCLDLTTTLNVYNNHVSGWEYFYDSSTQNGPQGIKGRASGKKRDSFAWDVRCMASVKLPWSLSIQATGRYASETLTAQGSRQGGWSVDAGIRKVAGNWSFSLNCRDIFDSRKFKDTVNGFGYTQRNERWRGGRRLQLTVKYSFGNMKAKRDKQMQGEVMDSSGYGDSME